MKLTKLITSLTTVTLAITPVITINADNVTSSNSHILYAKNNITPDQAKVAKSLYNNFRHKQHFSKAGAIGATAIAYHESNFNPTAKSLNNSNVGLYQWSYNNAASLYKLSDSLSLGSQITFINRQLKQHENNFKDFKHLKSEREAVKLFNQKFCYGAPLSDQEITNALDATHNALNQK